MSNSKSLLIICQQAPYGTDDAIAALDVAMSFAAFEQAVSLLFKGEGIWQLIADQQAAVHQQKRLPNIIQSFELYGLDAVYAERCAMDSHNISPEDCCIPVSALDDKAITELIHGHDSVLVF